jgi:hypothetical protein
MPDTGERSRIETGVVWTAAALAVFFAMCNGLPFSPWPPLHPILLPPDLRAGLSATGATLVLNAASLFALVVLVGRMSARLATGAGAIAALALVSSHQVIELFGGRDSPDRIGMRAGLIQLGRPRARFSPDSESTRTTVSLLYLERYDQAGALPHVTLRLLTAGNRGPVIEVYELPALEGSESDGRAARERSIRGAVCALRFGHDPGD